MQRPHLPRLSAMLKQALWKGNRLLQLQLQLENHPALAPAGLGLGEVYPPHARHRCGVFILLLCPSVCLCVCHFLSMLSPLSSPLRALCCTRPRLLAPAQTQPERGLTIRKAPARKPVTVLSRSAQCDPCDSCGSTESEEWNTTAIEGMRLCGACVTKLT